MDEWGYIQTVQKNSWFSTQKEIEIRVNALHQIGIIGHSYSIQYLVPFLRGENDQIQRKTYEVIVDLFQKIDSKKGYETLKHCSFNINDFDHYFRFFNKQECLNLFKIASFNSNGYVREYALEKLILSEKSEVIPFIIYRLADWVPVIKQKAHNGITTYQKSDYLRAFIENLPLFEWLKKVERVDLEPIYNRIMDFLVVDNIHFVIENFSTFPDRIRILIAKKISTTTNLKLTDLTFLLNDKHFLIRHKALSHFHLLTKTEIDNLLKDTSARIRLDTLRNLGQEENFSQLVLPFLTDNSASIRSFVRYSIKNESIDFQKIYNDFLLNNQHVCASLCGLVETNANQFIETMVPFLSDEKIKVRKMAFCAINQFDRSKTHAFSMSNLENNHLGIRNQVVDYFSIAPTPEVLSKARELFENGTPELKKSMLKLFSQIGKWTTIADLIKGTMDEDEGVRQLSNTYLQKWILKAASYFTEPQKGELESANEMFLCAFEIHERKKYFSQNPLLGLDFYLR